jgi:hypothetical protein
LPLGKMEVLEEKDEFPFLGSLPPGQVQTALCGNLFRTPLFAHSAQATDFLLVSSAVRGLLGLISLDLLQSPSPSGYSVLNLHLLNLNAFLLALSRARRHCRCQCSATESM